MIKTYIYTCAECPEAKSLGGVSVCGMAAQNAAEVYSQNAGQITETCPLAED